MTTKISVKNFDSLVEEKMKEAASEIGDVLVSNHDHGKAFEYVVHEMIQAFEDFPNFDPIGGWGASSDLGCDLWFENDGRKHLLLVQCKHTQKPGTKADEGDYSPTTTRWTQHVDSEHVRGHGNESARRLFDGFADRLEGGWTVEYRYVTNAKFDDKDNKKFADATTEVQKTHPAITITAQDRSGLKDYYQRLLNQDADLPEVRFKLQEKKMLLLEKPRRTILGVISGYELRALYTANPQRLYAYNLREYLGKSTAVNKQIIATVKESPEDFFYFNNGVSALCTSLTVKGTEIHAKDFQIINGAQTVTSLFEAGDATDLADVEVLIRVVENSESVSTTEGFNAKVVAANNTQNAIKSSDFRANDSLQRFLFDNLENRKADRSVRKFYYANKRRRGGAPAGKSGTGKALRLEAFAKMRYSYLYEPTSAHDQVYLLWDSSDGGKYQDAFGIDGVLEATWTVKYLEEARFILAVHDWLDEETKKEAKEDSFVRNYRNSMRFHDLSLVGRYLRAPGNGERSLEELTQLLDDNETFKSVLNGIYQASSMAITGVWVQCENNGDSPFGFRQKVQYWEAIKKAFDRTTNKGLASDALGRN